LDTFRDNTNLVSFMEATMIRLSPRAGVMCGVAALVALMVALPVSAQMMGPGGWGPGSGWGPRGDYAWGPGMMGRGYGPGAMTGPVWRGGMMCSPRAAGFAAWRIGAIEEVVRPTEAQRPALDALKAASTKAADALVAACPQDVPATSPARLEVMEKRLDAMLQAVKTVRPAFDAFYAVLTDEQKRRLDAVSPEGPWRWRMWRWQQSER
jgi:LTXXQ motif family protein